MGDILLSFSLISPRLADLHQVEFEDSSGVVMVAWEVMIVETVSCNTESVVTLRRHW